MTRSVGGRSRSASRAAPIAQPKRNGAPTIGFFSCTCTGDAVSGVDHGSGYTGAAGGGGVLDRTADAPGSMLVPPAGIVCSPDMTATVTLGASTPMSGYETGYSRVSLAARVAGGARPFNDMGYVLTGRTVDDHSGITDATGEWSLWTDINAMSTPYVITDTFPAPGDVLELTIDGTTITAKRNGSTLWSVTDSTVGPSVDGVPTSFASYEFAAQGTATIASTGFSVTPNCP